MLRYLWLVLGILIGFVLLFFLVDRYLLKDKKKDASKPTKDAKPAEPKVAKPETKPEPQAQKTVAIYNSNLADELDATLKQKTLINESRLNEPQTSRRGNIAQYIAQKKYKPFNFSDAELDEMPPDADKLSITKEDYKKIVALSNITDKK